MRYLKLFESFNESEIHEICILYDIYDYTINDDGSIDVNGDYCIDFWKKNLYEIPLKFNIIKGSFDCSKNNLKSLEGSPVEVNDDFYCRNNKLTSFKFAPKIIRSDFECRWNSIKSFEYFPRYIGGDFMCNNNPIFKVWNLFRDTTKIELLNDFDIFRDEDTDTPSIIMDRLNDFLLTIGKEPVESIDQYKNI